ncbi:metallophosphoesterase [Roseiconus lacunae]|uniref:metallophosphoesterase n=1 Tax=Roseiconus lacunae TaxID=2605694 RepID=UPI00308FB0A9|nr:metallophosphoesterase [Stieleria sp. HD01]
MPNILLRNLTVLALLLITGASGHVCAQQMPKAQFWEITDKWTHQTGLQRCLSSAGFAATPFDPKSGIDADCDLLVLGSFLSEDPRYRAWSKEQATSLQKFLDEGGVILQLTQADQTESSPAFIPKELNVKRTDKDGNPVLVLADSHPLVAQLPRRSTNNKQLELPMHHRRGSWESLRDQKGFRVLLTLDATNRDPVLVEAAVGKGRLLLTSLFFDKLENKDGEVTAPVEFHYASKAFFAGLHDYVFAVANGNGPAVEPTKPYVPPEPWDFVAGSTTVVALPDTQIYSERFPQHFVAQTEWVAKNLDRLNIAAVFHEGDITNRNTPEQWENAKEAMQPLWGKLPVICAPGNHDMGPRGNGATHESLMSDYLTVEDFAKHDSFQGTLDSGRTENNYSLFEAGGIEWIGIALEWAPRDRAVQWADELLTKHSDRRAILVTHAYTYFDDSVYDVTQRTDQSWSPYGYGVKNSSEGVNDAGDIWRKVIHKHDNVVLVLSGHVLGDGAGRVTSKTDNGSLVHQVLANYQMLTEGGQGWLRLMEFLPDGETIQVRTYSPVLDRFNTDPQHQFRLSLTPSAKE